MVYKEQDNYSFSTDDDASEIDRESAPQEDRIPNNATFVRRLFRIVASAMILLILLCGLVVYYFGGVNTLPNFMRGVIPDKVLFNEEDLGETSVWIHTSGWGGLELTVINALDAEWHPYFYRAVEEWDTGSPDSLILSTYNSDPDSECSFLSGFLKICNGNYGETDWKGINKVLLKNGKIESSIGQMNEFYFGQNDNNARQYTMCHEIGHGFGLSHTDGSMWNLNEGDCMDYTNRPANNKQPGMVNFEALVEMYGIVNSNERVPTFGGDTENKWNYGDRRRQSVEHSREYDTIPKEILEALDSINNRLLNHNLQHHWRALRQRGDGPNQEFDLGEGYTLQVHYLLAHRIAGSR